MKAQMPRKVECLDVRRCRDDENDGCDGVDMEAGWRGCE